MKHLTTILAATLVAGLTAGAGVMHGRLSERWGSAQDLLALGKRLEKVPREFGPWRMTASEELSDNAAGQLKTAGSFIGVYENRQTGEQVRMALLLGPSGPMSVHIAEVCLAGRDYEPREERERITITPPDGSEATMWSVEMGSNSVEGDLQHVCYAWSAGDFWQAPEWPRFSLAGNPYVYKLDVSAEVAPLGRDEGTSPCREFLRDLLPELKPCLVPPSTD